MADATLSEYLAAKTLQNPTSFPNDLLATLLARAGKHTVAGSQETVAAAVIARFTCTQPMRLSKVSAKMAVCGTAAGPSTAMVSKMPKDAAVASKVDCLSAALSFAHDDADGVNKEGSLSATSANLTFAQGDTLYIEVTAAATNAAGFSCSAELEPLLST